jgi:hypothetical protein
MIGNIVRSRPSYAPWMMAGAIDTLIPKLPGIATSTVASVGVTTGAIAAGSALSIALPLIGIALGAILGGLFAAHEARVKGATEENTVLNSLIPTVTQAVQAVFTELNNGSATPAQGIAALQSIGQQYWQEAAQVESGPGQAGGPGDCASVPGAGLHITGTSSVQNPPGSNFSSYGPESGSSKSCTASCFVGCMWVASWVNVGIALINAGGGQVTFDGVVGNKYGLQNTSDLSISYTPPAPGSTSAVIADVAAGNVTGALSTAVMGIPLWMLLLGGFVVFKVL